MTNFTYTAADTIAMAVAARIAGGDAAHSDVVRAARTMIRGLDTGMTSPEVGAVFGLSRKVSERIAYVARLARMVEPEAATEGSDACLTLLSSSGGRSLSSPVRILKRWQAEGTMFASWAAALAALDAEYEAQNPAESEGEEEGPVEKTYAEKIALLVARIEKIARDHDMTPGAVVTDAWDVIEKTADEAADEAADAAA